MKNKIFSLFLVTVLLFSVGSSCIFSAEPAVSAGDSFTYTPEEHWGIENDIWSWQWALANTENFSDMSFTTVEGQGECYVADWNLYPYCAARWGGNNVHPNISADAARVFTAPVSGEISVSVSVARVADFAVPSWTTPTSFRILLGNTVVYPSEGDYQILTSTTPEQINLDLKILEGEKLRFVVGSMGQQDADAVNLLTTVTYDSVGNPGTKRVGQTYAFSATSSTWGQPDANWSWEWTPKNQTVFSPMTYQFVSSYNKNMYVADWAAYPYSYVDFLGVKMHPALEADTVKTFTAPYSGTVKIDTSVSRYVQYGTYPSHTPTSLRILVNDTQVYPLYSDYLVLTDTTAKEFSFSVPVRQGDKIRFVVGGMGQIDCDAIDMHNTVTYTSLAEPSLVPGDSYTYQASESSWGTDIPYWNWEWRDPDNTFGPMTYQYIASYGKNMYASDWTNHAYNYVDLLGAKIHPAKTRDTVKTFTAPYSGRVEMQINIARCVAFIQNGSHTPTSLRVFLNDEQIWPADGSAISLTSTTQQTFKISADVTAGDKVRCVVGSLNQTDHDAVMMYNTVTYRAVGERELAMVADQQSAAIRVYDVHAEDWNQNEVVWDWSPTSALGFSQSGAITYVTDAKLRYSQSKMKHVVVVSASGGFLGVIDYATGQKIWEVQATGASNPHSIEYLPDGNIAAASSLGWVRIYKASQNSTEYVQADLTGAHGVLWDPSRNLLWALGDYVLTAYRVSGTAKSPVLTEAAEYRVNLPTTGGHDLSAVSGDANRLWVSTNSGVYQFDIAAKTFYSNYTTALAMNHTSVKGISNFPGSDTVVTIYPNNTMTSWNSDRVYVTLHENGMLFGRTQTHASGAFYKVRSWLSNYIG